MGKIVHICATTFTDGMAYQENLLTKYHVKSGHAVTVITSTWQYNTEGKLVENEKEDYVNQDNVHVRRLKLKGKNDITRKFRKFEKMYDVLCEEKPDILFIHGFQYLDILVVAKYIKDKKIKHVYIDNHADYSNSATTWLSKNIQHRIIWKYCVQQIEPYTKKFYGVLPARVDILTELYGLPKEKCELLVMGADDEYKKNAEDEQERTRKKYEIKAHEFILVTGGKYNSEKKQIIFLEKAIQKLDCSFVKLFIFGSLADDIREEVLNNCRENIQYVGWLSNKETHELIACADLAIYPTGHSTLWEQTAGQGVPMMLNYWSGVCEGEMKENVEYLYEITEDEIYKKLKEIVTNRKKYEAMKKGAEKVQGEFLYSNIARESIVSDEG